MGRQLVLVLVGVFVLLLAATGYGIYSKHQENETLREAIGQLRQDKVRLEAKVGGQGRLDALAQKIERRFNEVVEILPLASDRQQDKMLEALTAFRSSAKLEFLGLVERREAVATPGAAGGPAARRAAARRPASEFGKRFVPTQVTARYRGGFESFLYFLTLVEQRREFLRVDKVVLQPLPVVGNKAQKLDIEITISTFHYRVTG